MGTETRLYAGPEQEFGHMAVPLSETGKPYHGPLGDHFKTQGDPVQTMLRARKVSQSGKGRLDNSARNFNCYGANPYHDMSRLEIAGAESYSIRELTASYFAGHLVAEALGGEYPQIPGYKIIFDTSVVDNGEPQKSWGVHFNYQTPKQMPGLSDEDFYTAIGSMKAMTTFFGSGYINEKGGLTRSQRIRHVSPEQLYGIETTATLRPLVNTRVYDRDLFPGGRADHRRRLHCINNDGCMIPAGVAYQTTLMKTFLKALSQGVDVTEVLLDDPLAQAHKIGLDSPDSNTVIEAHPGKEVHTTDAIINAIKFIVDNVAITGEERLLLCRAKGLMEDFRECPQNTADSLDAVGKLALVNSYKARGASVEKIRFNVGYGWHRLDEKNILRAARRKTGKFSDDPVGALALASSMANGLYVSQGRARQRMGFLASNPDAESGWSTGFNVDGSKTSFDL